MPDRVVEYRCPACGYQIPLLGAGLRGPEACPECGTDSAPEATETGVDSSALLNLLLCGSCGCLLGRYWGIV